MTTKELFSAIFTISQALAVSAHCSSSEFVCNNGNCVQAAQECDGRDDCHDNSDEENCSTASVLAIATVIAVLFLLLFIALPIITCLVVWCCIERRRSNRHTNELDGHSMSSMTIISSAGIHNEMVGLLPQEDNEWTSPPKD